MAALALASQGRGKEWVLTSSIVSTVILFCFPVGLPFGHLGVALFYSGSCILLQLRVTYYIARRRGPLRRRDLWIGRLQQPAVLGRGLRHCLPRTHFRYASIV
jgi:O-antigen/teichoic acid export membrane protein